MRSMIYVIYVSVNVTGPVVVNDTFFAGFTFYFIISSKVFEPNIKNLLIIGLIRIFYVTGNLIGGLM